MNLEQFLENQLSTIQGWCEKDKARKMYDLISETRPSLCVEIGIFGGSSLIPQALSLKHNAKGKIVGIDPWSNHCAVEEMENPANRAWWDIVDLESVYNHFLQKIKEYGLDSFVEIMKNKSCEVSNKFDDESIDILHIDGNHCEKLSFNDALLYYPKVKIGGYIFFDDINWSENSKDISTEKGVKYLLQFCEKICIVGKDCMLMKKIK